MNRLCFLLSLALLPAQAQFLVAGAKLDQFMPAAAFDGTDYLLAWTDLRDVSTDTSTNIYACRVTPSGRVLDTLGLLIVGNSRDQMVPRVCRGSGSTLVIWQEGC